MKRKRKCYATPKWEKFCDGCKTNSTKCPYRYKYRNLRNQKNFWVYQWIWCVFRNYIEEKA